jgi:membrane-associated phospholipid phosphatase
VSDRFRPWLQLGVSGTLFLLMLALVQLRVLASVDQRILEVVAAARPRALVDLLNWIFRIGYAQVDAVVAIAWAAWLWWRRRSVVAALPPLVFFAAVGLEAGLRLVVEQPQPDSHFALKRVDVGPSVVTTIDRADAAARQTFAATAPPTSTTSSQRGSFPSGHACRSLFLALVVLGGRPWTAGRRAATIVSAGLVGYTALYFGYHWPSDVLAGYLLAAACYQLARWLRERSADSHNPIGLTSVRSPLHLQDG